MRQAGFSAFFHEDVFDPFEMTTPKGGGADSAPLVSLTVSGRAVSSDTIIWVDGVDDFDATLPVDGAMMDGKGGTKGKPTDDGGTGGGGGGGGGKGGGKPDKGGDTGGDTGGGTDGGTGGDTGGDPGGDPDGVLTTYTSGGDAATSYNVTIVFEGTWTVALQEDFIAAADYLSSIILGDQTDDTSAITGEFVDDVRITANLIEIDGTYGVLGRAGPQSVRTDTFLTVDGLMEFDIADAELFDGQGLWDDIVLHEMMHAIGFGTLWGYLGLTSGSVAGGDMIFTGDMATAAYNADFLGLSPGDLGYADGVPIETDGGSGTAGGHWDEELFANELLTGYINGSNYISTMTIAALEDMGYDTVLDDPNDPDDLFAADFIA